MVEYLIAGWIGVSAASAMLCIHMIRKYTHQKPQESVEDQQHFRPERPCRSCDTCIELDMVIDGEYFCENIEKGSTKTPPSYCKYYEAPGEEWTQTTKALTER